MARAPTTPRKSTPTTQAERTAKRLARQQKQLEKDLINEMTVKVAPNGGKMVKYSDLKKITPLTETQKNLFESLDNDDADAYLLHGNPGTGKTFSIMYHVLNEILQPESIYKKIIIIRSTVQGRSIGYLPGELELKYAPFELPYQNICAELTNNKYAYEKLKETDKLEFMCTAMLRGLTFNDSLIIFDECQNTTWQEVSTILGRVGKNSKLFCVGDSKQNDLVQNKNDVSGFTELLKVSRLMPEFREFKFTTADIVRSGFVKSFIIACEKLGL